jgi:hypothetical protein
MTAIKDLELIAALELLLVLSAVDNVLCTCMQYEFRLGCSG